jgi:hypothetical protein
MGINDVSKPSEEGGCVMWARAGLWMELDGKGRLTNKVEPFNGPVIGVDISDTYL